MIVGLAAGYDKDATQLPYLLTEGFDYVVVGSVTREARKGNGTPNFVTDGVEEIVNSLGMPSDGIDVVVERLKRVGLSSYTQVVVSVTGATVDDVLYCVQEVEQLGLGVELNISSPNYQRSFDTHEKLKPLLERWPGRKPWVKIAPYEYGMQQAHTFRMLMEAVNLGVRTFTVANSRPIWDDRLKNKRGGISGKPVFESTINMLQEIRAFLGDEITLNACGGIFSVEDAQKAERAGATTIQGYAGYYLLGSKWIRGAKRKGPNEA